MTMINRQVLVVKSLNNQFVAYFMFSEMQLILQISVHFLGTCHPAVIVLEEVVMMELHTYSDIALISQKVAYHPSQVNCYLLLSINII